MLSSLCLPLPLLLTLSLTLFSLASASTVPTLAICDNGDCPVVSRVGMGTLHLGDSISGISDVSKINSWILNAYNNGITLFDLADVYPVKGGESGSSATLFGQALAMTPGLRQNLTLVAKMDIIFPSSIDTSTEHLTDTLNWFLSALQTSYIDILLLHYSNSFMDATAVASLFMQWKSEGKVRNFGVSNHYPSKFDLLQAKLDLVSKGSIKLVTTEFECSVWNPGYMNYNSSLLDHAYTNGLHVLAWGALAGDPLGGLNRLFVRKGERQRKILSALEDVGSQLGIEDESAVALLWLLSHPSGIIPLLGTTNNGRLNTQLTAFQFLGKMTTEQWWSIGNAGGLCPLGDSQCNYTQYMP